MLHKNIIIGDLHYIHNWEVADETARLALVVTAADVGKVARQLDTGVFYLLTDNSPMAWTELGGSGTASNSFATIAVSGQSSVVADSSTDTLTLVAGTNVTITTDATTDTITINSSGGGSSGDVIGPASSTDNAIARFDTTTGKLLQNSGITIADGATGSLSGTNSGDQNLFSTLAVSGQTSIVADSTSDTLTLVAGSNITLTTDASTDTLTIASSGGGSGGLTFDTIQNTTSGTAFDFVIPASTKRITLILNQVRINDAASVLFQLGTGGVPTTTGYISTGASYGGGSGANSKTTGFFINGAFSTLAYNGTITFTRLSAASNLWTATGSFGNDSNTVLYASNGFITLAGELDVVRLTRESGSFDQGSCNVVYES